MKSLLWHHKVPFLKNTYLFRSIALWFLITIVIMSVIFFIMFIAQGDIDRIGALMLPMLLVYLFVFFLIAISTWIVLGNKYDLDYIIDQKGVKIVGSAERAQNIRHLAMAAGVISGKPGLTGAGLLVNKENTIDIPWKEVNNIEIDHHHNRIIIKCSFWKQVALHFPEGKEKEVVELIRYYSNKILNNE